MWAWVEERNACMKWRICPLFIYFFSRISCDHKMFGLMMFDLSRTILSEYLIRSIVTIIMLLPHKLNVFDHLICPIILFSTFEVICVLDNDSCCIIGFEIISNPIILSFRSNVSYLYDYSVDHGIIDVSSPSLQVSF